MSSPGAHALVRRGVFAFLAVLATVPAAAQVCDPSLPGCVDPRGFQVRAYGGQIARNGGKCLDYTPGVIGSPVFLNDCSLAHPVTVSQLTERTGTDGYVRKYEVLLRAGNAFIGPRSLNPAQPDAEVQLELQEEAFRGRLSGPRILNNQTFVYDGDSIILASDRDRLVPPDFDNVAWRLASQVRVAKVQNSRGANGSPIVLGSRQLSDAEFWEFHAIDGSGRNPTCDDFPGDTSCAFVFVNGILGLRNYFAGSTNDPATKYPDYDKVVIVGEAPILLSEDPLEPKGTAATAEGPTVVVSAGVTVRGDRRGTRLAPELAADLFQVIFFEAVGNDVRITGLRLHGGNTDRNTGLEAYQSNAIKVIERLRTEDGSYLYFTRVDVDHNDIGDWTWRAVYVDGSDPLSPDFCYEFPPAEATRPNAVRVARNFLHHNLVQNKGYGVNANSGAFPLIEGNTFVSNRHAIAATNSTPYTGYRAWGNIVLDDVPLQFAPGGIPFYTHDFDIHGTGDNGFCGIGGGYTEVVSNTFLGTGATIFGVGLTRNNFEVRGVPCEGVDFRNNVSVQDKGDTVDLVTFHYEPPSTSTCVQSFDNVHIAPSPKQFDYANPTNGFGVGDFDGDGRQDLFLATRTAFYYSPGAKAEWRLLATGRSDPIGTLRFGDFDADGRTDVIGKNGANIMVSWGGVGEWEKLNNTPAPIADLAVGNFDGVDGDDIFWATGRTWYLSAGGSAPFLPANTSGFRVKDLRFGDFNGNGKTDVFGIVSGNYAISDGATTGWTPLRSRLTDDIDLLFVANFDGDDRDDIGSIGIRTLQLMLDYRFSSGGTGDWTLITSQSFLTRFASFGRFLDGAGAGLLFWDGAKLRVAYLGSGGLQPHSRQDMK